MEKQTLKCSFCGKSQEEVRVLITGTVNFVGIDIYICNECINLCSEIVEKEISDNGE